MEPRRGVTMAHSEYTRALLGPPAGRPPRAGASHHHQHANPGWHARGYAGMRTLRLGQEAFSPPCPPPTMLGGCRAGCAWVGAHHHPLAKDGGATARASTSIYNLERRASVSQRTLWLEVPVLQRRHTVHVGGSLAWFAEAPYDCPHYLARVRPPHCRIWVMHSAVRAVRCRFPH